MYGHSCGSCCIPTCGSWNDVLKFLYPSKTIWTQLWQSLYSAVAVLHECVAGDTTHICLHCAFAVHHSKTFIISQLYV